MKESQIVWYLEIAKDLMLEKGLSMARKIENEEDKDKIIDVMSKKVGINYIE